MRRETHPGPKTPALPFFGDVVHAAYFQVYNVRGNLGIAWIYETFAFRSFRLDGNVNKNTSEKMD